MNFKQYLQQKGFIPKTIARREREIGKYHHWLGKDVEAATQKDILDYLGHIKKHRKLARVTQNQILLCLKNYYDYLYAQYGLPNPTTFIKIQGLYKTVLRPLLDNEQLQQLCELYYHHISHYTPNAKQLYFYPNHRELLQQRYLALTLMTYQGIESREIEVITPDSFDLRKATVRIEAGLRSEARILPLKALQMGLVIPYLQSSDPLIPGRNHLERLSKSLKKLYPEYRDFNQLRASRIVIWIKLYGVRKAQYLAGHKSIESTQRYLANDIDALKNDMQTFHPLG